MPLVEIKDFNAWSDNKLFFLSTDKKQARSVWKTCWNIKKRWLSNKKLIRLFISSKPFKVIGIDLSRQTNTTILQQINSTEKLEKDDGKQTGRQ